MNLRVIRKNMKLTQEQVANELGIPASTYSNYENGDINPKIPTLVKLADYFDISLDYLCGRQFDNKIGYIPNERKDAVNTLLELDDIKFAKLQGYLSALKED